ncbi:hypothetical protein C5470_14350 [Photorhabdus stackebrandtii]|uniref:Inclusion body protein n=2 Tax=Photorhabdus stackebrandtii TaxID=1123042 RepID=A0A7X5TLU6_9GAMM|nr:hypothetical protein [Photorhabdus stackebrandtii]
MNEKKTMNNKNTQEDIEKNIKPELIQLENQNANKPQTIIRIFVDTASVSAYARNGIINKGVYIIDNRANIGSTSQGTMTANTFVRLRDYIGFYIMPIDPTLNDTVSIEGFQIITGNVFGTDGYPEFISNTKEYPEGSFWIGRAESAPTPNIATTYKIKCKLKTGGLKARTIYFEWDQNTSITVAG